MKTFVTGGTGFVGAAVARALLREGMQVRALVRSSSPLENLSGLDIEKVQGDLSDPSSLRAALAGCDTVFHVAAHYSLWTRDSRALYRSNVDGTRNIMQAALDAGVKKVVYTSTVGCLGIPKDGTPGDEDTPVRFEDMVGDYKKSKFLAEEAVRDFVRRGLPAVIVNPSTPVGPNDIKPTPTGQIIVDFMRHGMPGYLDTGLNIVDVDDVAAGHLLAARNGKIGERYILGNENLSLKQIGEILAELTGKPAPRFKVPFALALSAGLCSEGFSYITRRPPAVPLWGVLMARKKMFFSPAKARRELGLPQTPAREALRRAVEWFRAHGYA